MRSYNFFIVPIKITSKGICSKFQVLGIKIKNFIQFQLLSNLQVFMILLKLELQLLVKKKKQISLNRINLF